MSNFCCRNYFIVVVLIYEQFLILSVLNRQSSGERGAFFKDGITFFLMRSNRHDLIGGERDGDKEGDGHDTTQTT